MALFLHKLWDFSVIARTLSKVEGAVAIRFTKPSPLERVARQSRDGCGEPNPHIRHLRIPHKCQLLPKEKPLFFQRIEHFTKQGMQQQIHSVFLVYGSVAVHITASAVQGITLLTKHNAQ